MNGDLVVPLRLYRQVADKLRMRMAKGEFEVGERLPTERDLARHFGVSRQVVREAIVALEISELVEVRGGSGAYVKELPGRKPRSEGAEPGPPGPVEIIDARLLVEPEIAALAAKRRLPVDLHHMQQAIDDLREELRVNSTQERADRRFHVTVAEATRNAILVAMVRSIWDEVENPFYTRVQYFAQTTSRRLDWIDHHEKIYDAIAASDTSRARATMRMHIEQVGVALNRI